MCQSWFKCFTWINSFNLQTSSSGICYYHFIAHAARPREGSNRPRSHGCGRTWIRLSVSGLRASGLRAALLLTHLDLLKPARGSSRKLVSWCLPSGRIFIRLGTWGTIHPSPARMKITPCSFSDQMKTCPLRAQASQPARGCGCLGLLFSFLSSNPLLLKSLALPKCCL